MARDLRLEELVEDLLRGSPGITRKSMFGGVAWMQHGNLLCGASQRGLLVRLGRENDAWALELQGVSRMMSGSRSMHGWVRVDMDAAEDERLRARLFHHAKAFVATLEPK